MKKLVSLLLALCMLLACTAALAEAKSEYNVTVLVWKFDDTYGSSVRQGMLKWAETVGEELGVKINLDLQDAGDDMAKQVEQCDQAISKNPDFVIINLAEPAGGQVLVDKLTAANIPFLYYNIPPSDETYQSVVADAGAFFVGNAMGKRKLAPHLSPNKSIEGAVGGLLAAIVGALLYGLVLKLCGYSVNFLGMMVYGLLGSLAGQMGDLAFSAIKREYGVKDYSNLLPGHGGMLDRFDSTIFTAPLLELLVILWPAISVIAK